MPLEPECIATRTQMYCHSNTCVLSLITHVCTTHECDIALNLYHRILSIWKLQLIYFTNHKNQHTYVCFATIGIVSSSSPSVSDCSNKQSILLTLPTSTNPTTLHSCLSYVYTIPSLIFISSNINAT